MSSQSLSERLGKKENTIRRNLLGVRSISFARFYKCDIKLSNIEKSHNKFILQMLTKSPADVIDLVLQFTIPNYYETENDMECNKCDNHCRYLYYNDHTKSNRSIEIKKLLKLMT